MKYKLSKPVIALAGIATVVAGFGVAALANADTTAPNTTSTTTTAASGTQKHDRAPGVHGTVTAISGTSITVTSTNPKDSTTTAYVVDASNAKIMKSSATAAATGTTATKPAAPTTVTISSIAIGDTVSVRGTINGTSVTATDIMDGVMPFGGRGGPGGPGAEHGQSGTITAVNGSTVTFTAKDGTTYTVDTANAKMEKMTAITASDLAVGDTINASGTVSGTTITATNIMDGVIPQGPHGPASTTASTSTQAAN